MLRYTILAAVAVLFNMGTLTAEESPVQAWMKYLEGKWTYEISDGTKGEAEWTFEADGQSMIGKFKEGDVTGVEIGGWQPDTKIGMVNGYDSKRNYWQIEYSHFSDKGGRGPIRGKTNGVGYSGDFEATIIDRDLWSWTIKGKTSPGEDLNLSAEFKRVKSVAPPTNADHLQSFKYFIGKWKSETDDGEVAEWTFDWGHNQNSIENKLVVKNADGVITLWNTGVIAWDRGDRRIVNACVSASGNRLEFLWQKSGDEGWLTWLRGSQSNMPVTIVDKDTWRLEWDDQSRTYIRQD